jgi:hypothetical protein
MGEPRIALDPSDRTKRLRPVDYLFRSAVCHLRADKRDLGTTCKSIYGDDRITPTLLQRAASTPATVATPAWAGIVAQQVVSSLLQEIVSISAGAALLTAALQINFDRKQSIRLPSRLVDPAYAGTWLGEGAPIPVYQFPISAGVTLVPHKLAVISVFTREMIETSNIEEFVRSMLSESAALALDKALFSSAADDGITPGGILNGVAALPATAAGGSKRDAMVSDLEALVQAIANKGGGANPVFIAAPAQAIAMKANVGPDFDADILASTALPAGTVICVEARSVVATITAAAPEFSIADATLLQMADNPVDVVAGSPTRSVFQIDSTALKMVLRSLDWKLRAQHCAYVAAANW